MAAGARPASRLMVGVLAALGALLAGSALTVAKLSASPRPSPVDFWPQLSASGSEVFVPRDLTELANAADLIVLGRVSDVAEGRAILPDADATPADPAIPAPRSVFVTVTVQEVVAGDMPGAGGATVRLEMPAPPQPLTASDLKGSLPDSTALFFLWNGAALARRNGASQAVQERERDCWFPVSSFGIYVAGSDELLFALHPDRHRSALQRSFQTGDLDVAASKSKQARRK